MLVSDQKKTKKHDHLQAAYEVTGKQARWKRVHFCLPLHAGINQRSLKRWKTRLIPRGTQEPLCKVRQLGETEHMTKDWLCYHCMSLLMGADMCCLDQ